MKKIFLVSALSIISFVSMSQTAEEIVNNYYQAIGGAKWDGIKSILMSANVDAGGMKIPLEIVMMNDGRMYTKINFQGQEIIQGAFDGTTSWSTNFMTQKAEKSTSDDTENAIRSSKEFPDALICYKKLGYTLTLEGEEKVDGVACHKLKLEKKTLLVEGKEVPNVEYYFIDKDSNVPIMKESEINSGDMKGQIGQTKFSDYQEVNGVILPFSLAQGLKDGASQAISFDKVLINASIDEKTFVFPEE